MKIAICKTLLHATLLINTAILLVNIAVLTAVSI